ncbi:MAG: energy-coupling factor transporter ATPase [Clostridia bacterium]|jgi:energy-coupling factor transport system ATP-binding protein|nr:energy-coupling factor transporter ATPase [Clostridia bacterium]MBQ5956807.1 energy-coupling factor transporter ATPase [Clostridia bacterium]MBR0437774.1 energy-coupling factor transporter ATPase [Clostridia bacterium]MBR6822447.1 energy-coupling factor transporter ATPase [Clostridia bacterium]
MSIIVENLSYTYMEGTPFEHLAVDDISLEIKDGEFVGIIGHTGSGKSTLIQIISGLLKGYKGNVLINGVDYSDKKADKKALRRTLGVVFQYPEYQLFEETVEKDVAYGPKKLGFSEEETALRVRNAIELVGLDYEEVKDKSPFALSGGQKRKAAIAGVLSMDPDILILDEPIAGLDPAGRESFMEIIKDLNTTGKTIIMISHNMDNIAEYTEKIFVLKNGRIFMEGSPVQIFNDYEKLLEADLDLPDVVRFCRFARENGVEIPKDIIRYKDLLSYLGEKLGRMKHDI